jgi:uncharacterized protein YndB with AHSA1/START domain
MQVEQTIEVASTPEASFELFTDGIDRWWPLAQGFAYGGERAATIHLEPWVGGRFFERLVDGDELRVGTVTECDPPRSIVFTWTAPDWPAATEVEVRFERADGGTRVLLRHRLFERLGDAGEASRDQFGGGWPAVLAAYAAAASAAR